MQDSSDVIVEDDGDDDVMAAGGGADAAGHGSTIAQLRAKKQRLEKQVANQVRPTETSDQSGES